MLIDMLEALARLSVEVFGALLEKGTKKSKEEDGKNVSGED